MSYFVGGVFCTVMVALLVVILKDGWDYCIRTEVNRREMERRTAEWEAEKKQ
jgi:hypothetical protein